MPLAPSSIDLFTTQDCNLRCTYCYIPKQPQRLDEATARATVDWLLAVSPASQPKIYFFGGEPLLEFGTMQAVVSYGREAGRKAGKQIGYGVTTNGTIWSDEIAEWLRTNGVGVNLSMDGAPGAQDRNRATRTGAPTYTAVRRTLEALLEGRPRQGVRMTFDAENVQDLADNVRHVWGLGCRSVHPAPAIETPWTYDRLMTYERQLLFLAKATVQRGTADYYRCGSIEKAVQKLTRARQRKSAKRGRYACGAGHSYLAVACNGSLYPCHRFVGFDAYRLGDVFGATEADNVRLWSEYDCDELMPGCYACPARDMCNGNCAAVNYAANGTLNVPSLTQCAITRIEARVGRWMIRNAGSDLLKHMTRREGDGAVK